MSRGFDDSDLLVARERDPERRRRLRRNVIACLRLAWHASPSGFVTTIVVSFLTSLIPPGVVWLGKHLVDLVAAAAVRPIAFSEVLPTVVGLGLLAGSQRALNQFESRRQRINSERVRREAERRFLAHVSRVDLGHFDNSDWHDRVARAKRDLSWRMFNLTNTVVALGGSVVTLLGMLGVLLTLHPLLAVLSLASVIPAIVTQRQVTRHLYRFWFTTTRDDREQEYIGEILSQPRTAKEIRAFSLADLLLGRHQAIIGDQFRKMVRLYRRADKYAVLSGLVTGGALALAYGFVASRGLAGTLTPGDLTAVTGAFVSVSGQVTLLASSFLLIGEHAQFLDDYFSFLEVEPLIEVRDPATPIPERLDAGIAFEDVWFRYPRSDEHALQGLSLRIEPGEMIALVGDNGAGKTTMVKLLLRFYDVERGSVRLGGVDLREADPEDVRARLGVLFQDYANYELSVRENVAFGRAGRNGSDEPIEAALRAARADRLVKSLPSGLDSNVGRLFEGGHDLSGGEWQRLALARLMYRAADVWILDEPTASLDAEAEAGIFAELRENLRGRIGIIISHRFSTVRIADRIAVVDGGRVTELGMHEELLALGGRYATLFELQAAGYR